MRTQTVALSGTGVQPATLSPSSPSLSFSAQVLGVASTPSSLTVTNGGRITAANVGFQITGAAAASFATGTTTCTATLAAGSSCTVQVILTPVAAGSSRATLIVSSATSGVIPVTVPLDGLNVNPANLDFAPTVVGSSSAPQTVTISNTSSMSANQLTLFETAGYTISQNTC